MMQLPRVKPEHAAYRIAGGRIRLGGVAYGIAAELPDPDGLLWTLLESMDGTRSRDAIITAVRSQHPTSSQHAVKKLLDQLELSGYVEDSGSTDPEALTSRDRERYSRSRGYFRWVDIRPRASTWDPQVALKRSTMCVVGVGGTGGSAAMALAASGVGHLVCVDCDVVELSNLNRQLLFTEGDIGLPKAAAAVSHLRQLNSDIHIEGVQRQVSGEDDFADLARACDVLLLCADNPRDTRLWANRGCLRAATPWIDAGYHGPLAQVASYVPGQSACWECVRTVERAQHDAVGANSDDGRARREAAPNAVNAITAAISGNLAAHAAISLVTGAPPVRSGAVFALNLYDLAAPSVVVTGPKLADCPACGDPV